MTREALNDLPCGAICAFDKLGELVTGEHTRIEVPESTARGLIQLSVHPIGIFDSTIYKVDQDDGVTVLSYLKAGKGYLITL